MDKPFRFAIPESIYSVLDWFTEALELEVRRFGNSGVEFSVEGPRSRIFRGSDGHAAVLEIVILGFRTLGKPIPSDWAPETCIVGMEGVWEPLGSVMAFQFVVLDGSTRVWATFKEKHPAVQVLFEEFLKRIDANYPMDESLARRYRTQRDLQLMERIDRHLTAESHDTDAGVMAAIGDGSAGAPIMDAGVGAAIGDGSAGALIADAGVGAAIEGGTAAGKTRGPQHQQRKLMRQLWHARDADIRQRGSTQPFSYAWKALRLDAKTVKRWIPQHIIENWRTRKLFTWEQFTALWPEHRRNDYAD